MRALFLTASLALLALAGCHDDPNEEAAQCPRAHLLQDYSRQVRYDGRGSDLSDLMLSVRLSDVQGACSGKLGTRLEGAHAHVVMVVTRGPAATSANADITYRVGVVRAKQILDAKTYTQHVKFPPNVTTLQVIGREIPMELPTAKGVSGQNYDLYFGLQLTPQEVDANRRNSAG